MVDSLAVAVVLLKTIPILAAGQVELVPFVSFGALLVMAIQDLILRLESVDLIIPPMLRFGVIIVGKSHKGHLIYCHRGVAHPPFLCHNT